MSSSKSKKALTPFAEGVRDGFPIGLGYLSVSIGFGIMAAAGGLSVPMALFISMTNLTSAGQVAGLSVITAGGGFLEMALTQLVINLRYALMSISLSQKLDSSFTTLHRMTTSFGMTDEVFAVASRKKGDFGRAYMYGLILLPYIGWALGTLIGALAGTFLPEIVKDALGIAIYGMFVAIVLPPARKNVGILAVVLLAAALSCLLYFIPLFSFVSDGYAVIVCGVLAAAAGAWLFPIGEEADNE